MIEQQIEIWKEIEGFSRYMVSPDGEVLDTKTGNLVAKQLTGKPQYYYVNMNRDDGKRKLVRLHRLVAEAYIDGRSEGFGVVDHIDRDKLNNHYTNLRWVNNSGNQRNTIKSVYVNYEGEDRLLIEILQDLFDEDEKFYQGVYQNIIKNGLCFEEAVDKWLLRKKRK